jgi:Transcriptional regulators of sugar metabolism
MWAQDRHQRIRHLLRTMNHVTTEQIARELSVSRETVRRDLLELEAAGELMRVHGGATLPQSQPEEPFTERLMRNRPQKQEIARAAAALFRPGQSCFIDAGTTTALFAEQLAQVPDITVVTNSIDAAMALRASPAGGAHLLGGELSRGVPATLGAATINDIARFQLDVAVLSPVALHPQHGAMDFELAEVEVAAAMIRHARTTMLLADSTKLGLVSRSQICPCGRVDTLVTDRNADPDMVAALLRAGVREVVSNRTLRTADDEDAEKLDTEAGE